jgi:pimeloyl-ACP methyl ester carboxylesterase
VKGAAHTVYGDPAKPVILFMHGIRLGREIWDEHARILCDEFCVIATDLPGHADLRDVPFSPQSVEQLLLELLDRYAPQRPPLLVGYSLGGYVAGTFGLHFPERTAGIVLSGATTDIVGTRAALYSASVAVSERFSDTFLERSIRGFFRLSLPKHIADLIVDFDFDRNVFRAVAQRSAEEPLSERLRRFEKPALIVNGQFDPFRLDERKFARALNAPVAVIPWSDHVAPLRQPRLFAEIVRVFAREVFAGAPYCLPMR